MTDAINSHSRRMYNAQKKTPSDLSTPLDDPRVLALVEAATELEKQAKKAVNLGAVTGPHWTHLGLARMKMAVALSALEENK